MEEKNHIIYKNKNHIRTKNSHTIHHIPIGKAQFCALDFAYADIQRQISTNSERTSIYSYREGKTQNAR